ncbi:hypothetical protein EDB83DRAFT_2646705 [Lactarius deliciosus]|nr:hypothetical protein EDB83DRAFT_2646705 [Lactarius deliciosus]
MRGNWAKKCLEVIHALACYSALSARQDRGDELITMSAERNENELEGLHALPGPWHSDDAISRAVIRGDSNWRMGDGNLIREARAGERGPSNIMRAGVWVISSTPEHRLSLRKHSQATRARALNPLAADAGRTQLELRHHQGDWNFSRSCRCSRKTRKSWAGKAAMEKFTLFFDLLDDINEQHQLPRVLEDDEEQGAALLEDEVVKLVVPSL